MINLVENLPQSIKVSNQMQKLGNLEVVQMNMRKEGACLVKQNSNVQVCTLSAVSAVGSEWNSEKQKIAKCLRKNSEEYDEFTSDQLNKKKESNNYRLVRKTVIHNIFKYLQVRQFIFFLCFAKRTLSLLHYNLYFYV